MTQVSPPATATATAAAVSADAPQTWHVLLAPAGDLSGDGQLRELIRERRERQGGTGAIWYLQPRLVADLGLGQGPGLGEELEAVVTPAASVLTWLQLRFGGRAAGPLSQARLTTAWLDAEAGALPPGAPLPRVS
ncbi:hypothetical protein [Cyanobium sp. CH-040]|uniref:hypothetical protein n=1 Tax=Cyanobium sp. CH-040 TaxID=2823708 RepID=UPI0020CF69B4|nr:hypothetical protein [Cyanobium sp. CH-040]MCP9929143.1 hypothetical protein [Cyanobium sp. CH-040]